MDVFPLRLLVTFRILQVSDKHQHLYFVEAPRRLWVMIPVEINL